MEKTTIPATTVFSWDVEMHPRNLPPTQDRAVHVEVQATSKQEAINKAISQKPGHTWGEVRQLDELPPESDEITTESLTAVELESYKVEYRPAGSVDSRFFQTMARSAQHAANNCRKANPACTVVKTSLTTKGWKLGDSEPVERKPWRPSVEEGTYPTLEEIVGQAIGTGSMCWTDEVSGAVFDNVKAEWVVEGAIAEIRKLHESERFAAKNAIARLHEQLKASEELRLKTEQRLAKVQERTIGSYHYLVDADKIVPAWEDAPLKVHGAITWPNGAEEGETATEPAADPAWAGARDDDKLDLIRGLLSITSAQGSTMARFMRQVELILNA